MFRCRKSWIIVPWATVLDGSERPIKPNGSPVGLFNMRMRLSWREGLTSPHHIVHPYRAFCSTIVTHSDSLSLRHSGNAGPLSCRRINWEEKNQSEIFFLLSVNSVPANNSNYGWLNYQSLTALSYLEMSAGMFIFVFICDCLTVLGGFLGPALKMFHISVHFSSSQKS